MAPYDPQGTDGRMEEMLPADCLSIQEIGTAGRRASHRLRARADVRGLMKTLGCSLGSWI